jgi:hypothetical protein
VCHYNTPICSQYSISDIIEMRLSYHGTVPLIGSLEGRASGFYAYARLSLLLPRIKPSLVSCPIEPLLRPSGHRVCPRGVSQSPSCSRLERANTKHRLPKRQPPVSPYREQRRIYWVSHSHTYHDCSRFSCQSLLRHSIIRFHFVNRRHEVTSLRGS